MLVLNALIERWRLSSDVDCHVSTSERHLKLYFLTHLFSLFLNSGNSSFHLYSFTHPIEKTSSTSKSWIISKLFFWRKSSPFNLLYHNSCEKLNVEHDTTIAEKKKVTEKKKKRKNILYYCPNDFHRSKLFLYNKIMLGAFLVPVGGVLGEGGRAGREVVGGEVEIGG